MFFLEELQGGGYDNIMSLPWSRRKRFVEKKQRIENRKAEQAKQAASRSRARRHR